jgi:hypothetical protein
VSLGVPSYGVHNLLTFAVEKEVQRETEREMFSLKYTMSSHTCLRVPIFSMSWPASLSDAKMKTHRTASCPGDMSTKVTGELSAISVACGVCTRLERPGRGE